MLYTFICVLNENDSMIKNVEHKYTVKNNYTDITWI